MDDSQLQTAERKRVECHLGAKWGVAISHTCG